GGRRAALKFSSSLSPAQLIGQIQTPACHFYSFSVSEKHAMRALLRKHQGNHLLIEHEPTEDGADEALFKGVESMLLFLETKLKVPPKS
ncbi:MAG TPA: hypothetical protein VEQ65_11680, partial [Opitutus sp.]|nr:hypothetical protein [Opitutus sp.]